MIKRSVVKSYDQKIYLYSRVLWSKAVVKSFDQKLWSNFCIGFVFVIVTFLNILFLTALIRSIDMKQILMEHFFYYFYTTLAEILECFQFQIIVFNYNSVH